VPTRLSKPLTDWTAEDVTALVDERVEEGQRLEFKRELNLETRSQRVEAAKDVSGMANAALPSDERLATQALIGHVLDAHGTLVTGAGEHFVNALAGDAERTRQLGLVRAGFVSSKQGAPEVAPGLVEALKRVECFLVGAEHSLDFGLVWHASTITRKGILHLYARVTCTCASN
jgi:hypothetical protein